MIENGAWARIRAARLMPVLGSSSIRYRRAVRPFQKFTVTCRAIGWDERWMYLEHRILVAARDGGEDVAAIAVMKAAFLGPDGRVATEKLIEVVGFSGPRPEPGALIERVRDLDAALTA
jgi:acyl-CoA thioesterase FadM